MNKLITYDEMKTKHEKELGEFPIFFAYSDEQYLKGMKKFGLNPEETDKLYRLPSTGGFIKKESSKKFSEMFKKHTTELEELKKNDEFLLDAILYELGNHEFCITYDPSETIDILDLDISDERISGIFKKAKKKYFDEGNF